MRSVFLFSLLMLTCQNFGAVVNFDDQPATSPLTNQYISLGVTFNAPLFDIRNETFQNNIVTPPSSPNYARMLGTGATISFNVPGSVEIGGVPIVSWDNLGLRASSGYFGGYRADAFNIDDQVIATVFVPPVQQNQSQAIFQTTLNGESITRVRFTVFNANAGDGLIGFDNLTFPTPVAVPEPSSLVGLLMCASCWRRRF